MEKLKNCISNQISIDNNAMNDILSVFETKTISKGEFLLKSGSICKQMVFIESGYLRMYDIVEGKEITFWIGNSGRFITSLSSFLFESKSMWNIQALTDCKLHTISRKDHFKLIQTQNKWLEFDNKLLAYSFALLENKMFSQLHTTAKQRYNNLLQEDPELFLNVPLQYIASMLGITPESLSRLRKNN